MCTALMRTARIWTALMRTALMRTALMWCLVGLSRRPLSLKRHQRAELESTSDAKSKYSPCIHSSICDCMYPSPFSAPPPFTVNNNKHPAAGKETHKRRRRHGSHPDNNAAFHHTNPTVGKPHGEAVPRGQGGLLLTVLTDHRFFEKLAVMYIHIYVCLLFLFFLPHDNSV